MSDGVARYYDRNTRRFLLVGRGRAHSIHRELWGPGVRSARDAVRFVDRLIADEIDALAPRPVRTIADFGCGVGGSLLHLAERFPDARLHGVTISGRQVEIGERLVNRAGMTDRCAIVQGDFHSADLGVSADAIIAVESLAHSDDVDAFLGNAARHLAPGGALVIADDFLATDPESLYAEQRRRVDQLRAGWRLPGLRTVERVTAAATAHHLALHKDVDLSGFTRPGHRVRDRAIALCSPLFAALGLTSVPFFGNMIGGNALQAGLMGGYIRYRLLVFEAGSATDRPARS